MSKSKEYQDQIDGLIIARALIEFKQKFRDVYPQDTMERMFTAVGPTHTFIGYMVARGFVKLSDEPVKPRPRKRFTFLKQFFGEA